MTTPHAALLISEAALTMPPPVDSTGQRRLPWLHEQQRIHLLGLLHQTPEALAFAFQIAFHQEMLRRQEAEGWTTPAITGFDASPTPEPAGTVELARIPGGTRQLRVRPAALAARSGRRTSDAE